jgi:Asp-tRNA(Asn)/Glu-tRNA(Gln) amidotransferase A subunit family amidase
MKPTHTLTVRETAEAIRSGQLSAAALVEALVARIDAVDPQVKAWLLVDRQGALETARKLDTEARAGRVRGPLHGVPVGLKDIYHAAGMVTTAGAGPFAHETPSEDAESVARLRRAGAIIMGKLATTEFAYLDPAETRNPWNVEHTPGGSSAGSGAAVGARMVPLALGSQTVGSTLRPAAYCGVVGFKPSHGRISCRGVVALAWNFDHVGIFCRSVADSALALQVLAGHDPTDPLSARDPVGDYVAALSRAPERPRLGFLRQLTAERAGAEVTAHLEAVAQALARAGAIIEDVKLPASFDRIHQAGTKILQAEAAAFHAPRFATHAADYRPSIRALIETGLKVSGVEYLSAQQQRGRFRVDMAPAFERFDALLSPAVGAPAPKGLGSTGDPYFCAPWSFIGMPAISIPSGLAQDGLPLAVQLVSGAFGEEKLLGVAAWCEAKIGFTSAPAAVSP